MTTTTIRPATPLRPIASPEEEARALDLFLRAAVDDAEAFAELVPEGTTPKPVAIAEDGSAAELDLYPYDRKAWSTGSIAVGRIVVR